MDKKTEEKTTRRWNVSFTLEVTDTEAENLFDDDVEEGMGDRLVDAFLLFQAHHPRSNISITDGISVQYVKEKDADSKPMLQPGSTLVFTENVATSACLTYLKGDKLTLLSRTDEAPFGFRSVLGNWNVKCKHLNSSVWSSLWGMLEEGTVKLAEVE